VQGMGQGREGAVEEHTALQASGLQSEAGDSLIQAH
jgi:hypothetical protein